MLQALNTKDFGILTDAKKQTKKLHPFKRDRKSQGIRFQAVKRQRRAKEPIGEQETRPIV